MNMKRNDTILLGLVLVALAGLVLALAGCDSEEPATHRNSPAATVSSSTSSENDVETTQASHDVDLAICLDTSGSMDGLIESTKQKLWAIVNELATARPRPNLRVALYQYGNDGLNAENGWVEQLCPLTDDLDLVYQKLFELRTNGGTEYVARVVRAARNDLAWSEQDNALKIIVVAGNEAATQDESSFPLETTCRETIAAGIIVNSIFCGNPEEGRTSGWADVARWTDGQYAAIDQNDGTVEIATPYDKDLLELNQRLNTTYLAYGQAGAKKKELQEAQDSNAAGVSAPAAAQRVAAKASGLYQNQSWDLVDASQEEGFDLEAMKLQELPAEMQSLPPEQQKEYLEQKTRERETIQNQIQAVNAKRAEFVRQQMEQQGLDESASFDAQIRTMIRTQGQAKGMQFQTEQPAAE